MSVDALDANERRAAARLVVRGWARRVMPVSLPAQAAVAAEAAPAPMLNAEQAVAVAALSESLGRFQPWMLHGVTGSGKTEVYLRLMEVVLSQGDQVLFLVPEIGLTPQLEARIRARCPRRRLVTLHSGLNARERADNWIAAQAGEAQIVLGTRSAEMRRPRYSTMSVPLRIVRVANTPRPWIGE